jgi:hypothetical protein
MVTPSAYLLPIGKPLPLASEDEELLRAEKETLAKRERRGQPKTPISVPWLRRSEFITAVFDENLYNQSASGAQVELVRAVENKSTTGFVQAVSQFASASVDLVLHQFERANSGVHPVHPTNPKLKPVSVQQFLPNTEFLANSLSHVLYEVAPVAENDLEAERRKAILLPQMLGGEKACYIRTLPNEPDDVDELFGDAPEPQVDEDGNVVTEVHKTAAYAFKLKKSGNEGKYVLVWGKGTPIASYVPISLRVELHDLSHDFRGAAPVVNSRFKVAKRPLPDDVLQNMHSAKFQHFFDDPDEGMEEGAREADEVDLRELEDVAPVEGGGE